MKIPSFTIIFSVYICLSVVNSKSLKSYSGNSLTLFKGQRKPLATPLGNSINENYKRAKRQVPPAIYEFQEILNNAKLECLHEMNMNPQISHKSLLYEEQPTQEEKCLIMCMLKKTKLMENSNKLSLNTIARIADSISDHNPLVVSVALVTANNCNNSIKDTDPCEAAYQINRCIGDQLKAHKLKFYY